MEEQLKLNEIENQATNVVFSILKVESVLAAAQRDRANLTQERRAAIENDIIRLEREGAQYEIELKATRAAHLKLTGIDLVTSSSEKQVITRLEVVRNENGQTQTLSAKQFTLLQPGDIYWLSPQTAVALLCGHPRYIEPESSISTLLKLAAAVAGPAPICPGSYLHVARGTETQRSIPL